MAQKIVIVNAPAILEHPQLKAKGLVVGYDSIEEEVQIQVDDDLHIITNVKYITQPGLGR